MQKEVWVAIGIVLVGLAGILVYQRWDDLVAITEPEPVSPPAASETAAPASGAAAEEPEHPMPAPDTNAAPDGGDAVDAKSAEGAETPPSLPPLDESDGALREDLAATVGAAPVESFLIPERIVRRTVVTIDNLGRRPVKLSQRPLKHVPGQLTVAPPDAEGNDSGELQLLAANAARYSRYVEALAAVDAKALVALYARYYPLFQEAYRDLGYPDRYFNDRLIAIIDHLLATPEVAFPIELTQPDVLYEYADRDLEGRSWGQKTLIRMGPEHMRTVKAKLREIRAAIVARSRGADGSNDGSPTSAPEDAGN